MIDFLAMAAAGVKRCRLREIVGTKRSPLLPIARERPDTGRDSIGENRYIARLRCNRFTRSRQSILPCNDGYYFFNLVLCLEYRRFIYFIDIHVKNKNIDIDSKEKRFIYIISKIIGYFIVLHIVEAKISSCTVV